MSTTLKSSVHQLVDEIENEQLLETLRDFLSLRKETQPGKLWEDLPEDKKQEILLALEESADESTLISREDFLKRKK
ncbi:MAG: hypothetical protein Q8S14_15375 [Algoriphagus sp.]|uniref:hypothetical protein n=1 Tax=Algoriphagus sp. TaxID=1872435 RepID=UPI00272F4BE6|nr:hypothetical protein [Algoriphagus sp.]MDP2042851.1 hypothetical protein [Algoriphagus sp.]MDP3473246.1 hypothetical protein [Algoriphagus sp.]